MYDFFVLSQTLPVVRSVCIIMRVSRNYHWAKMTSGVFMLDVFKDLSKQYLLFLFSNNGHISNTNIR